MGFLPFCQLVHGWQNVHNLKTAVCYADHVASTCCADCAASSCHADCAASTSRADCAVHSCCLSEAALLSHCAGITQQVMKHIQSDIFVMYQQCTQNIFA